MLTLEAPEVPARLTERFSATSIVSSRVGMTALHALERDTGQAVFIKYRDPELDENAAMRVSREADVLASLDHKQIPGLIEADPEAELPYLVTEWQDFHPKVTKGFEYNPHPAFAAELCVAALKPLSYAHERGFTHRDIKPCNLLMTWNGDVAVTDWEIALCKDREMAKITYTHPEYSEWRVTQFGKRWGSPEYMSPEQARGREAIQDGRSDIYSLGIVLHILLEWKKPIMSSSSNKAAVESSTQSNSYNSAERPIPSQLRSVLEKSLQERPEDRYQAAEEMSEDLDRYLGSI